MKQKPEGTAAPKAQKPKSRFRLELIRHNHRVVITDAIDKGRYVNASDLRHLTGIVGRRAPFWAGGA